MILELIEILSRSGIARPAIMEDASLRLTPDRVGMAHRSPPHWLADNANCVNALVSSIYRRQMKRHSRELRNLYGITA